MKVPPKRCFQLIFSILMIWHTSEASIGKKLSLSFFGELGKVGINSVAVISLKMKE
jgi:hypothetical protein